MNSKSVLITISIWLTLTIGFAALGVFALDWQKWHKLAKQGVETKGKVVGKEPDNHRFIRYSYVVGQRTYTGLGSAGGRNPEFEQMNIGDGITVTYDSEKPEESISGDPKSQAGSVTFGVLFLAIVGPSFSMIGLYARGWLPVSTRGRI